MAGVIALGSLTGAAAAEELFQQGALAGDDLARQRGGWEPATLDQVNITDMEGSNSETTIVNSGDGAGFMTGRIDPATMTGNSGVTSLMQNTGNVVNMNYAMSVNVYLQ